jgi:hypothetical protein
MMVAVMEQGPGGGVGLSVAMRYLPKRKYCENDLGFIYGGGILGPLEDKSSATFTGELQSNRKPDCIGGGSSGFIGSAFVAVSISVTVKSLSGSIRNR